MTDQLQRWSEQVRECAARAIPLQICGGGSKAFYGQATSGEVLDTRAWQGIVSYEPTELVVTVRAGTPLTELEATLAASGQFLAFDPPHYAQGGAQATVGGMVAAGLAGPSRLQAGGVKDYMLGAELINGRGELLRFGGQVMKNVAGYDVARLLPGSLGTLGLITEVSLKVLPLPVAEATLVFECDEAEGLARMGAWLATPLPINASCWHDNALSVRLRGARAALEAARAKMGGQLLAPELAQKLWQAVQEQRAPFFALQAHEALLRISVPDRAPSLGVADTLIEWGGALRWIKCDTRDAATLQRWRERLHHVTVFRGRPSGVDAFSPLPAAQRAISRRLKENFDPSGIFNRGRLYPDW